MICVPAFDVDIRREAVMRAKSAALIRSPGPRRLAGPIQARPCVRREAVVGRRAGVRPRLPRRPGRRLRGLPRRLPARRRPAHGRLLRRLRSRQPADGPTGPRAAGSTTSSRATKAGPGRSRASSTTARTTTAIRPSSSSRPGSSSAISSRCGGSPERKAPQEPGTASGPGSSSPPTRAGPGRRRASSRPTTTAARPSASSPTAGSCSASTARKGRRPGAPSRSARTKAGPGARSSTSPTAASSSTRRPTSSPSTTAASWPSSASRRPRCASSISADGGRTWSVSKAMGFPGHCPYLLRTSGGIIVLAHRLPQTSLHYTFDEGATWSGNVVVDDRIGAYPSMVELKDGSVLIVYYEEGAGSNVRARRFRVGPGGLEWLTFGDDEVYRRDDPPAAGGGAAGPRLPRRRRMAPRGRAGQGLRRSRRPSLLAVDGSRRDLDDPAVLRRRPEAR